MSAFGLADSTLGALTLKQCSDAQLNPNAEVVAARGSGNVAPDEHFIDGAAPVANFTSMDVATILAANTAAFANSGLSVSSGSIIIPFSSRVSGGTYAGVGEHTTITAANGLTIPTSLSIPGKGMASINLETHFQSTDGQIDPFTIATDASRTTGSFNAAYRLYPCSINGSAVAGISNVSVNFGITLENNGDLDGFNYPTEHFITETSPTIDITFKDKAAFETYGAIFTTQTAAVVNLQKMAPGGTVVSTATSEHITLTFADGIITAESIGGQGTTRGEVTLKLTGESLTVSTTATL
jgi:hypothetical protein